MVIGVIMVILSLIGIIISVWIDDSILTGFSMGSAILFASILAYYCIF